MSTICAPAYANIFVRKSEKLHIYPLLGNFSTFYSQFIDDIFFLWNGTKTELIKFTDDLNQKHLTIKFEFTYARTGITFLNTKLYKNENRTLSTTIYRKPSDRCNFLRYKLAHPKALKGSIPYRQTLRKKRICSEISEEIRNLKDLKHSLIKRGHQSKILTITFKEP